MKKTNKPTEAQKKAFARQGKRVKGLHGSFNLTDFENTINEFVENGHKKGIKYDEGKTQWNLLPLDVLEGVVKVLEYGINKGYPKDNWKYVIKEDKDASRYYNATLRHLIAWQYDTKNDPESGLNHLAHAICNLIFQLWKDKQ